MSEEQSEEQPKVVHKGIKKGLYLIPTAFTAANIAMGFLAILSCVRGFQIVSIDPSQAAIYFDYAAKAIGFAILFDTLDGRLARMTKTATELGVQLDSLADVLTFGIAPVVLLYSWGVGAGLEETSSLHNFGIFCLFVYLMCGTLRLARFNIQATRPRVLIEGTQKIDKKHFVGLPIPPAAGLLASIVHFVPMPISSYGAGYPRFYTILILILACLLGFLMVSTIRYNSFKNLGRGRNNLYLILVLGIFGMLVWLYSQYVLIIFATIYVSHGLLWYLFNLLRPSKRKEKKTIAKA